MKSQEIQSGSITLNSVTVVFTESQLESLAWEREQFALDVQGQISQMIQSACECADDQRSGIENDVVAGALARKNGWTIERARAEIVCKKEGITFKEYLAKLETLAVKCAANAAV
jgi:hypothetical protein